LAAGDAPILMSEQHSVGDPVVPLATSFVSSWPPGPSRSGGMFESFNALGSEFVGGQAMVPQPVEAQVVARTLPLVPQPLSTSIRTEAWHTWQRP